jgi:CHAT domain-containing protein
MTEFYNNWVGKKQSKREAFRNAQNAVRYAKDANGEYLYSKPVYWAGFVMLD